MEIITVQKKAYPPSIRHCQLHGDPYEIEGGLRIRFTLPSGKRKSLDFGEFVTNEKIIETIKGHPYNLKNYEFKFIDWIPNKQKTT